MAQQTKLPDFIVKKSKDFPDWLLMWCPRDDCPSAENNLSFLADARTMRRPLRRRGVQGTPFTISARPCPYCFRSALVPRKDNA